MPYFTANNSTVVDGNYLEEYARVYLTEPEIMERYVGNQLWNWGSNGSGQLGDNTVVSKSSPVQTVSAGTNWKEIATGQLHTVAIKTDGTLWTWGYNLTGQLGDNTSLNRRSSPVQTAAGGSNWKLVSSGAYMGFAIKTDGTLWGWGFNSNGQLADTTQTTRSSPIQTISAGNNWKLISCGDYHNASIKTDGTLWTWGTNNQGRLGDNTTIHRSSPVQTVAGGTNWKGVSAGQFHTASIKTDGTLWTWGNNSSGQLGDNTNTHRSSPVQTASGGTNWKQVAAGGRNTASIKTDGTLWVWGVNTTGTVGDNTITNRSSPVQTVSGGTNWKKVAAGENFIGTIKTDGTLWTWGHNNLGQLGDNTTIHRSSPVQTISGGTNWKEVSVGNIHTVAVTFAES